MPASRRTRIVLRIALYGGLLGCAALIIAISSSARHSRQRAKARLCQVEMHSFLLAARNYQNQLGSGSLMDGVTLEQVLRGQNPQGVIYLDLAPRSLSSAGRMVDPWQTPYEINAASNKVSIRSAGPNKRLGDKDDLSPMP